MRRSAPYNSCYSMTDAIKHAEDGEGDPLLALLRRRGIIDKANETAIALLRGSITGAPDMPIEAAKQALWTAWMVLCNLGDYDGSDWAKACWDVLDEWQNPFGAETTRETLCRFFRQKEGERRWAEEHEDMFRNTRRWADEYLASAARSLGLYEDPPNPKPSEKVEATYTMTVRQARSTIGDSKRIDDALRLAGVPWPILDDALISISKDGEVRAIRR